MLGFWEGEGCKSPLPSCTAPFQRLAKPWRGKGNEALDLGLGQPVLAVAGTHVFVVNGDGNSVTEIDARTGALAYTLTAARYHLDNPVGIAVVGHRMWLLNSPSGRPGSVLELAI